MAAKGSHIYFMFLGPQPPPPPHPATGSDAGQFQRRNGPIFCGLLLMYFFSGDTRRTARSLFQAFLSTPEVRTLQRMGFKRRTLEIVIKHQLQKTGKAHSYDFFRIFFSLLQRKQRLHVVLQPSLCRSMVL